MKPNSFSSTDNARRCLIQLAWLTVVLISAGCAHISELREAQTLFNQASTMRNQAIFQDADLNQISKDNLSANLGLSTNQAFTNPKVLYAEARDRLKRLDNAEDTLRLQRDGLLGHKLTLEALCHLELGEFAEARDAAARAKAEAQNTTQNPGRNPPEKRDQLLWRAMPGLIILKQAYRQLDPVVKGTALADESWMAEFQRQLIGPRDDQGKPTQADEWNAFFYLKQAREEGGTHPVCIYFTMCELSAFRYLQQAHQARGLAAGSSEFNQRYRDEVTQLLRQLKDDLPLRRGQPRSATLNADENIVLGDWCGFFGYTREALDH